mmetsp:Transcript_12180/g.22796  ORF Transcript_12180/g.22796 Transcript_12180/m.22796 type:complete len:106 (-) Transcript_12180:319-636(-)
MRVNDTVSIQPFLLDPYMLTVIVKLLQHAGRVHSPKSRLWLPLCEASEVLPSPDKLCSDNGALECLAISEIGFSDLLSLALICVGVLDHDQDVFPIGRNHDLVLL